MASKRAEGVWRRFAAWYGADVLERKYGLKAPPDWCEVIDDVDGDKLPLILADVRMKFPHWPPGLPEFEALVRERKPKQNALSETTQERLTQFVSRARPLTQAQLRSVWTWLYVGDGRNHGPGKADPNLRCVGVVVPADGESPGYRVMVDDMEAA